MLRKTSVVLCAAAGMAIAGPPNADLIGDRARVMVHVDLEALNNSTVGEWFLTQAENDSNNFEELRQVFPGFSLRAKGGITGITAYASGLNTDGPDGLVMLIQGNKNLERWNDNIEALLADEGYDPETIAGHSALVFPMDDETGYLTLINNGENDFTWVLGLSENALANALAVFDGEAQAVDDEVRESIDSMWSKGSIVMFGTAELGALNEVEFASAALSMAEQVWGRIGERGGEIEAQVLVYASEEKYVQQIVTVYKGLFAFGSLMKQDNEEIAQVMELLRGVDVSAQNGALSLSFEYDADAIIDLIESEDAEYSHSDAD